jgi:hypothetical protein
MPVESAQVNEADLTARSAQIAQPREPCRNRGTDSRIEPKLPTARLPRIPDRDDFLRLGDSLALSLGA